MKEDFEELRKGYEDKKTKLKKKYWIKGKSKFANARFVEEGVENINQLTSKLK